MEKESESIQIKDKRRFNPDGSLRTEAEADVVAPEQVSEQKIPKSQGNQEEVKNESSINFSTFVFSLASSAQMAMGHIPNPRTGRSEVSLESARQTIDILDMLEAKTKNNLSKEEDELLHHALHDLHISYVQAYQQSMNANKKGAV